MEATLRGIPGYEKIVVDAYGRKKTDRELGELSQLLPPDLKREPLPGNHVVLSIDADLQRIVEKALSRHHSAAAAVVEADTGKVLAIASYPSPDPNQLSGRLSHAEAQRLQTDPFRPLLDKALRESYLPRLDVQDRPGAVGPGRAPDRPQHPHPLPRPLRARPPRLPLHEVARPGQPARGHRPVVQRVLLSPRRKVGLERMAQMAAAFGFGQGLDLGMGEASGFMPTLDYYKKTTVASAVATPLNTALGQGRGASQRAAACSGLRRARQRRQAVPAAAHRAHRKTLRRACRTEPASPARRAARLVRFLGAHAPGPRRCPRRQQGHRRQRLQPQPRRLRHRRQERHRPGAQEPPRQRPGWDTGNDHAWFVGYAPSHKARIAVAVLIEHGGLGGHVAAPTAIDIIRGYFDEVSPEDRPKPFVATSPAPCPSQKSAPVPVSANPQ